MKRGILIILLLSILALGMAGCNSDNDSKISQGIIEEKNEEDPAKESEEMTQVKEETKELTKTNHLIEITSTGYSPKILTIKKGDSVTFINKDSKSRWPATDNHPTHKLYPNSNIQKCGTEEESMLFDSCKGLGKSEEYSFTFNEIGNWDYHDHLKSSLRGTIIVE